jgi:hypothetical protein
MNQNVQELVNAMMAKDATRTENAFQAAMAEKISAKLDDMRQNMAQSMFRSPTEESSGNTVVEEDYDLETIDSLTEEQLDEVLTKKTPASNVIKDFVHSDNPKFEGKSKKERIKMALGAYYAKHPEKSNK